jgi:hypothetical protein
MSAHIRQTGREGSRSRSRPRYIQTTGTKQGSKTNKKLECTHKMAMGVRKKTLSFRTHQLGTGLLRHDVSTLNPFQQRRPLPALQLAPKKTSFGTGVVRETVLLMKDGEEGRREAGRTREGAT